MIPAPKKKDRIYDHAHHAGNAADVFKHVTLHGLHGAWRQVCAAAVQWVDTHAAAGFYRIGGAGEWERGILRAIDAVGSSSVGAPASVSAVVDAAPMTSFRTAEGRQTHYPGSSLLLSAWLSGEDSLHCCEYDPAVAERLRGRMQREPRAQVLTGDAWDRGIWASALSVEQPVFMLIDPPYADVSEWTDAAELALWLVGEWSAPACAVVWYPIKGRSRPANLRRALSERCPAGWWQSELVVDELAPQKGAMSGSGMLLVTNTPALHDHLWEASAAAAWLGRSLGEPTGWSASVRAAGRPNDRRREV